MVRTGALPGTTVLFKDRKANTYFEVNGLYALKEHVNIRAFPGYTPETESNGSVDNNDFVNAGVRFAFNF